MSKQLVDLSLIQIPSMDLVSIATKAFTAWCDDEPDTRGLHWVYAKGKRTEGFREHEDAVSKVAELNARFLLEDVAKYLEDHSQDK